MAPKSLPHSIPMPGMNALFGGLSLKKEERIPVPPVAATVIPSAGEGPTAPGVPFAAVPIAQKAVPAQAAVQLHPLPPVEDVPASDDAKARRRQSKSVRVTQPETKGNPKGRHTLVIGEDVLEELSLLAWAENMSVSAIAREAFEAYLKTRQKAIQKARELRESFAQPREAV